MRVAYARISTLDQSLELQLDALKKYGCEKVFTDKASGSKDDREGLREALDFVRKGDELVVWRLDRLGRSIKHLIQTVNELNDQGVNFTSLTESISTESASGRLVFHIFSALAEFERDLIRMRTKAGLEAARARGRKGGRPRLMESEKVELASTLMKNKDLSVNQICETLKVSRSTLYRSLRNEL